MIDKEGSTDILHPHGATTSSWNQARIPGNHLVRGCVTTRIILLRFSYMFRDLAFTSPSGAGLASKQAPHTWWGINGREFLGDATLFSKAFDLGVRYEFQLTPNTVEFPLVFT